MQFRCERDLLTSGLGIVERAASPRDTMPVLTGIRFEALAGGRLVLAATDLELAIECSVPAEVEQPGAAVLTAKLISAMARKLPGDQVTVSLNPEETTAEIVSGSARYSINSLAAEDFPSFPKPGEAVEVFVPQRMLKEMIRQTIIAAATDDARPFLTGILLEHDGTSLRLVTTDSSRLAFRERLVPQPGSEAEGGEGHGEEEAVTEGRSGHAAAAEAASGSRMAQGQLLNGAPQSDEAAAAAAAANGNGALKPAFRLPGRSAKQGEPVSAIVPARAMAEVARLCADGEDPVRIRLGSNLATFEFALARVATRLIEGQFPRYRQVFLDDVPSRVRFSRAEMLAAVERAAIISRKGPPVVILDVARDVITLSSREAELGQSVETVPCELIGPPVRTCYQARFLVDVLRAFDSEMMELRVGDPERQGTIRPVGDELYRYILMPVRTG